MPLALPLLVVSGKEIHRLNSSRNIFFLILNIHLFFRYLALFYLKTINVIASSRRDPAPKPARNTPKTPLGHTARFIDASALVRGSADFSKISVFWGEEGQDPE